MRRLGLAAFAATLALGVAQAATVAWTQAEFDGDRAALADGFTPKDGFSIAMVVDYAYPGVNQGNNNSSFFQVNGATLKAGMGDGWWNESNVARASVAAGGASSVWNIPVANGGKLADGQNVLGIVFSVDDAGLTHIDWYVNGIMVTTLGGTYAGQADATFSEIVLGAKGIELGGEVYYAAGVAGVADFGVLPEPGALALLALGVAGLALRRRAA